MMPGVSHAGCRASRIAPRETLEFATADGAVLAARVHGPAGATRLVLSHGNGLAIDGYRGFWSGLAETFEVVVFDMRGHGLSAGGPPWHHAWPVFADDIELVGNGLKARLGAARTIGVFHSLSAIAALWHARRYGTRWDGLLLFDPPLTPPNGHPLQDLHRREVLLFADRARARRARFADPGELAAQFARARSLARWTREAYVDMAEAVLIPDRSGGWRLRCPPELEARIFDANMEPSLWPTLAAAGCPIKLVCGDPSVPGIQPPALIGPAAAKEMGIAYEFVPETTHFLQLERPDLCRDAVRRFVAALDGAKMPASRAWTQGGAE